MKRILILLTFSIPFSLFAQFVNPDEYKATRKSAKNEKIDIYYNKQLDKYDLYFVKLDIEVSDQSTYISGNASLEAKATESLDTLLFDFSNYMTIDSVLINDSKLTVNHQNNIIEYVFINPLAINEKFKVQIFYHGTPSGGGVSNSYSSEWSKNVTWTLSESFHAYEWWPCKQVLSDKIDSTHIFLTCDADCKAGSNGLLTNIVDLPNNKKRFEWKSNYPINYYLISFSVAEYQEYNIYANPEGSDSVLIQNFIYNTSGCLEYYKSDIDNTSDFIELYSDKFGLYPFSNEKYGHCLAEIGGGMEHQTMTTLGNFGYLLVAHELGHMWFGDYVTCATWQDIWINEGFASYTEYVALENLQSLTDANNWMNTAHTYAFQEALRSIYIPFAEAFDEGRIFNYKLSYKKGAAILHTLRHEINNDELFFSSIREYLNIYADSVATGDDFKNVMESETGIDFDPFFDQWYYGKGYPRFDVGYSQTNDTLYLTVSETASSSQTPLFQLYVDYKIYYSTGDTTLRLFQSKNTEIFEIPFSKQISNIIVDPDNWIANTQGTVTSTESLENNKDLFIFYPNPAQDYITINFNFKLVGGEKQIEIIDVNGRLINTYKTFNEVLPIDVSNLSEGIYFIKVISLNNINSYKFIKQ